jgi:MoxR-like ATPase
LSQEIQLQLPAEHRHPDGRHPDAPGPVPYRASDELIEAVNLAIFLDRPLLLEGEAGSGKSQLAWHVAHRLGLPLFHWPVRSSSNAQEGLYSYDAILRLHDVHLAQLKGLGAGDKRDPQNPMDYVTYGALGRAFQVQECSAVVLIDEIDKADIDFPNDLLTVFDERRGFPIREADLPWVKPHHPPIVIVTSNKEKANLPLPFLRRCIYYFIRFPTERLQEILAAHEVAGARPDESASPNGELVAAALNRFLDLRKREDLFKKPGTSELLDWLKALARGAGTAGDPGALIAKLKNDGARLPYPELLLKLRADWQRILERQDPAPLAD